MTNIHEIPYRGVDLAPERRPGVPMEAAPHPRPGVHWNEPDRMQPHVPIQKRAGLDKLTPVFGTAQPPHGFSGIIRRAAYRLPDHRVGHWAMLLFADRVDVLESRIRDIASHPRTMVLGGLALLVTARTVLRR